MNWIILGGTGFVGRHLARHVKGEAVGSRDIDLCRSDLAFEPDDVVVLAACLTPEHCKSVNGFADNLAMVTNVARANPRRLVYISSDAVYPFGDGPVTESSPVDADSYYALSKLAGEKLLRLAVPDVLIVRPTAIYGPGDTHGSYGPNRFAKEKVARLFGNGEETRDHIHVDDVVALIAKLVEAGAKGTYNLVTGTSVSFAEIAAIMEVPVEKLPRKSPITHRKYDNAKLLAAVPGYRFKGLREGLLTLGLEARPRA